MCIAMTKSRLDVVIHLMIAAEDTWFVDWNNVGAEHRVQTYVALKLEKILICLKHIL